MLAPRIDEGQRLLGELPGASAQEKVEVWSRSAEEGTLLELIEYRWGSGLGWYVQKRISLDSGQVEALRSLLVAESAPLAPPRLQRPLPPVVRDGNVVQLVFE